MIASTDDNEQILWSGSVSHWHYAYQWLFIGMLIAGLVATFIQRQVLDAAALLAVRAVLGLIVLALLAWIRLDRSNRKCTITNKRIIAEFGIVSKRSNELRIQDIGHISLTVTGLWDLVGIGELEFTPKSMEHTSVIFQHTPDAQKLLALVRSLQSSAV